MVFIKGVTKTVANLLVGIGIGLILITYIPIVYSEIQFRVNRIRGVRYELVDKNISSLDRPLESGIVDTGNIIPIIPVDERFSIIIEKIGVNAPVVANVTTVDTKEYMKALKYGVAHARGTSAPGQKGNTFLFAHSSLNFWSLGKYATVFNLLNKLVLGDKIIVYYQNQPYVYEVFDVSVIKGWNTRPLSDIYQKPALTLVTCSPPGTTLNRLVVRAHRIN